MKPVIYYRDVYDNSLYKQNTEFDIAKKYFKTTDSRMGIENSLVIGRYSVRPFYKELENDLEFNGNTLINSFHQHHFIANFNWYEHVKDFTPKTYFNLEDVPKDENKDFVVKGRTNSRKSEWNTKMFAHGYSAVTNIYSELQNDGLICNQGIVVREFAKLNILETGINGLPFANEFRFFFLGKQMITNFFYWTISNKIGTINQDGIIFAQKMADILSEFVNFFVIDIAQLESGEWILIEVNDGQMSGLNEDYCDELYKNLAKFLTKE